EVVVAKNDLVLLGDRSPDVRLLKLRVDVEIFIIPEHLRAGAEAGGGFGGAFDVGKVVGPGGVGPGGLIGFAVHRDRTGGAVADVAAGDADPHFGPVGVGCGGVGRCHDDQQSAKDHRVDESHFHDRPRQKGAVKVRGAGASVKRDFGHGAL